MEEATMLFDKELGGAVEDIVVGEYPFLGTFNGGWLLYLLGLEVGFVLCSRGLLIGFVASRAQSWVLQDHIVRDIGICGIARFLIMLWMIFVVRFQI
ncbi:hypothetical protein MtrunA17_Chr6g0484991 [Medicago truncatula]|uniref:Transmembrane protein n=1 Tax=Medicago truncatula TaxID=3880 RepID=A0A396HHP8_MEDTR|nr:hypothetical protein MtrunA17_Chr6g0484991 [Medicago truncatula]